LWISPSIRLRQIAEPFVIEAGDGDLGGRVETGARIQDALSAAGVEFIAENGKGHHDPHSN
jgi:hypothetical protein